MDIRDEINKGCFMKLLQRSIFAGGNAGRPESAANAAVICASGETPFMSGADIVIDGAASCARVCRSISCLSTNKRAVVHSVINYIFNLHLMSILIDLIDHPIMFP